MQNLIITAYFNIKSKFPSEQYFKWIKNFIGVVKTNIVLFTSPDLVDYFKSFNCKNLTIIPITLEETYFYQFYHIFQKQWEKDLIKERRSPELYIIWYNKLWFIKKAFEQFGDKYTNYFWCDIGAFRDSSQSHKRKNFGQISYKLEKLNFLILRPPSYNDLTLFPDGIYGQLSDSDSFLGGGIIALPFDQVNSVFDYFIFIFNKLCKSDRFFGCDQRCYAYMWGENPELFNLISVPNYYKLDPWFYLLDFYSK